MDFHSMKRKQLQALCKQHKIPANLSNLEMANKLTKFLKEKEDTLIPHPKGLQDENAYGVESADVVVNQNVKKVRFSPECELIEFTRSLGMKRSRRNSVLSRNSSLAVENVDNGEMNNENCGEQGRVTRSRGWKPVEAKVNERKRGNNDVNLNDKIAESSAIEIFDNGKLDDDVGSSARVMPLRRKMLEEGLNFASKRGKDDKRDRKAVDIIDNVMLVQGIVDNPGRVTRSRVQKLTQLPAGEEKGEIKSAKGAENVAFASDENGQNRVAGESSFMDRGDVGEGKLARDSGKRVKSKGKGRDEVLGNKRTAGVHDVAEPLIFLRRSKRNANTVADSENLNVARKKQEDDQSKGSRRTQKLLSDSSGVDGETGKEAVLKIEEPKMLPLLSNRRKNVIESDELKVETGNQLTLKASVSQSRIAGEVPKDEKKILHPTGVTRRSRRETTGLKLVCSDEQIDTGLAAENLEAETKIRRKMKSSVSQLGIASEVPKDGKKVLLPTGVTGRSRRETINIKLVSANELIDTDPSVQNFEAEKNRSEPCAVEKERPVVQKNTRRSTRMSSKCKSPGCPDKIGGGSIIDQKYTGMKRKSCPDSGGDVIEAKYDPSCRAETMREGSDMKAVPASSTDKTAATRKRACRLDDFKLLDASLGNGWKKEELFLSNMGFINDPEITISDVGPTSGIKSERKKPDIPTANRARRSDMKSIDGKDGKELANPDTNAVSRNTQLKTDFADYQEDQVSASNIRGVEKGNNPLEIHVHGLVEQNITDMDKSVNSPDAHVLSQMGDLGCDNKIDNHALPENKSVGGEGFDEAGSSSGVLLLGDNQVDVDVAKVEVDKCSQPSLCAVDHVGEMNGIFVQENLESDGLREYNKVYSKFSETEGFAETASSVDNPLLGNQTYTTYTKDNLCVAEVEAAKWLPSSNVVDHIGEAKGTDIAVGDQTYRNIDLEVAESDADNCSQSEGSNVSGNKDFAETNSSVDRLLLGDQEDIGNLGLAVVDGVKHLKPSSAGVDHVNEVKATPVSKNLDSGETRQSNDVTSLFLCHRIDGDHLEASGGNILDNSNEDTSSKAGDIGSFDSCERCIDCTHSKSTMELKVPSSGMLRSLEADGIAEGNKAFFLEDIASKLAEANEDDGLDIHKSASYQCPECGVHDPFDCEGSARSDLKVKYSDSLAVSPVDLGTISAEIKLMRIPETDHRPKREENGIDKSANLEDDKTVEGGSSKVPKSKYDEDGEFSLSILFESEGRSAFMPKDKEVISGEYSIKDFGEQEKFHGFPSVPPEFMTAEGNEAYIYENNPSESIDDDEGGCLKSHKRLKDEDTELIISNLLDGNRSARIAPRDEGTVSAQYSVTDFDEKLASTDFPSMSTTFAGLNEVKLFADSLNLQELSPSKLIGISESQAEQPKSPLAEPMAFPSAIQTPKVWSTASDGAGHATEPMAFPSAIQTPKVWSTASDGAGHAKFLLNAHAEVNIIQAVQCSSADDDDKGDCAGASVADVKLSTECSIIKVRVEDFTDMKFQETEETEEKSKNLLAMLTEPTEGEEPTDFESIQSWTGIELQNLFGATMDNDASSGLNDTSSQGTEIASLAVSPDKSISSNRGSLTKKNEKEMDVERSESAKITNENVVLPTIFNEVSHTGFDLDGEENLLATSFMIVAPGMTEETCSHDRKLDRTVISVTECFGTMKTNRLFQCKTDEKDQHTGYELENSFCLGDLLSDNGEYATSEELDQAERVELVNTSTTVHPEAEHDGCEAFNEQWAANTGDCLKETNLIKDKDTEYIFWKFDAAPDSDSELTEKNIFSTTGKVEGCRDMLIDTNLSESQSSNSRGNYKSEGEMTQSREAEHKLSGADLQKYNIAEESLHLTARYEDINILSETPIQTYGGLLDAAEVAGMCSFDGQKVLMDKERGDLIREHGDPYGAKDETDGNPISSHDNSDELHPDNEKAILNCISVDYSPPQKADNIPSSLELHCTCNEEKETVAAAQNVGKLVAAGDQESPICSASHIISSSARHVNQRDEENVDTEKSEAGPPVFNFEGEDEKNGKEVEESATATMVQISISQLHTISDVPASGCDEVLEESDVADTIKEYIDSESSLPMIFGNPSANLPFDVLVHGDERTVCEDAAFCKNEVVAERCAISDTEDNEPLVDCLETETKEVLTSGKAVKYPACFPNEPLVDSLVEGIDVKLDAQRRIDAKDGNRSPSKQLKKNARTILIHGTPGKLLTMMDMKENTARGKGSNAGDLTTVRPAKRRALQDVKWK